MAGGGPGCGAGGCRLDRGDRPGRRPAAAAAATARHLTLTPRVRAAQLVLGAVIPTAVSTMLVTLSLWWSATQDSVTMLVLAMANLAAASAGTPVKIRRAVRRGRRLRSASSGR